MKLTRSILALTVVVMTLPTVASGQGESASTQADENIVLASQKSPRELRRDLWQAEKDFYAIYNRLNDDGLYDVRCSREAPTGSVIKIQTCRPKFLDRALREGEIKNAESLASNTEITEKMATFRENLEALVAENPELQSAATTLNLAHARLEANSGE